MRKGRLWIWIALLVTTAVIVSRPATGRTDPDQSRRIAREAYIVMYPLVMSYRAMYLQAIDLRTGGFGKWISFDPAGPGMKHVITPNIDTPYLVAWVDLRTEPWVLTVPPIGITRYLTSQWNDLWGFVIDNPGVIKDGNGGGNYLLVPPDWNGDLPKGIKRAVRGESVFLGTLTRTELLSPADTPAVMKIRQEYKLQPLSSFSGKDRPEPAPAVAWLPWKEESMCDISFFGYANFLLQFTRPHAQDKEMLDRMASIGISPGKPWKPEEMDEGLRRSIKDGIADALQDIRTAAAKAKYSNKLYGDRTALGRDYLHRAAGAYISFFGNVPTQTMYFFLNTDENGLPLEGSRHAYTMSFPAGSTPPNRFFWCLTAYSLPEHSLATNPSKRYSIGTHSLKLDKGKGGSITIYIQKDMPAKDRELNWLPVPAGPFSIVLQVYGPGQGVIYHDRPLPLIKQVREAARK